MSGGLEVLAMKEDDVTKMLAAGSHIGDANVDFQMADYVYKTKADGTWIMALTFHHYSSSPPPPHTHRCTHLQPT